VLLPVVVNVEGVPGTLPLFGCLILRSRCCSRCSAVSSLSRPPSMSESTASGSRGSLLDVAPDGVKADSFDTASQALLAPLHEVGNLARTTFPPCNLKHRSSSLSLSRMV
jgi:hypothetical protein